jgi:hypothetical protein
MAASMFDAVVQYAIAPPKAVPMRTGIEPMRTAGRSKANISPFEIIMAQEYGKKRKTDNICE